MGMSVWPSQDGWFLACLCVCAVLKSFGCNFSVSVGFWLRGPGTLLFGNALGPAVRRGGGLGMPLCYLS